MKHKVRVMVESGKKGLFGGKKKVLEKRVIEVDKKTYKKMQREKRNRPFSIDEMLFYDEIFDD